MILFSQVSEKGGRRVNEDSVGTVKIDPQNWLFMAADGLGGHGGGEVASAMVLAAAEEEYRAGFQRDECLARCFEEGQRRLLDLQHREGRSNDFKSTLTLLQVRNGWYRFAHIGDTRLYLFKDQKLIRRTLDHSLAHKMAEEGKIPEEQIRHHNARNRLMRVMGSEWKTGRQYEISEWMQDSGDLAFLLCTDGFWEYIDEEQMQQDLIESQGCGDWLGTMIRTVCENAPEHADNYSAVAVIWDDDSLDESVDEVDDF